MGRMLLSWDLCLSSVVVLGCWWAPPRRWIARTRDVGRRVTWVVCVSFRIVAGGCSLKIRRLRTRLLLGNSTGRFVCHPRKKWMRCRNWILVSWCQSAMQHDQHT